MKKLAIVTSHPIQYNAPLFELLTERSNIDIKVFYTWGEAVLQKKYDPGFGKMVEWDIPLLNGYAYEFLKNIATEKGSHHFKGIDNPSIIEAIKKYHPDAVLVYGWAFKSHLKILRYFKNNIPVLFRGDSTLLDESGFLSSLKRNLFLRWVYRHIDIALFVGKNNYGYFRKAGIKKKQLLFAPHVVDNERFSCSSAICKTQALHFRNTLNVPYGDFVFLYAGKFEAVKDPALIPEAFLSARFPGNVHLVMVGNGNLEKELKGKYSLMPGIHFMDFKNQMEMPSVYEMADVFILSSKSETWGLSINEAMANGKAVIVSDKCGCAADLVDEGMNGFVFKTADVTDLKDKMKLIYEKRDSLDGMKNASKEKIKEYSLTTLAVAVENAVIHA
ncbi:MAG: glycosyltransferase family 4 protein [Ginsengibacter sp.]